MAKSLNRFVALTIRVAFSLLLGFFFLLIVGVIGLAFIRSCPEGQSGFGFCFRKAPWVDFVATVMFIVGAGFAWWISGLLLNRYRKPREDG